MEHDSLTGRRLLVVGATSGIGRAVALSAAESGGTVAVAARRVAILEEVVAHAPDRVRAFGCDVTDDRAVSSMVAGAALWMGGIDLVVYAAGLAQLISLADAQSELWRRTFDTNLVGAATVVADALGPLRASDAGTVVLLSSHIVGEPWPGLVLYSASKAALNELARGLRVEEPGLRILSVAVGPTATSFADDWEPARAAVARDQWATDGYLRHRVLEPAEVAEVVLAAAISDGPDDLLVAGEER